MTTLPSGEASIPTHGDSRSSEVPIAGFQSQVSLPAEVTVAAAVVSAEEQDVDRASIGSADFKPTSASGDENKLEDEAAPGHRQEPKEAMGQLVCPTTGTLKMSKSLQSPVWDGLASSRITQSPQISQSDSLFKKEAPRTVSIPGTEKDLDPSTPSAEVQLPQNVPPVSTAAADNQPDTWATSTIETVEKPDPSTPSAEVQLPQNVPPVSTAAADNQPDTCATGTIEAVEKPEGLEALNPDTEALPSVEFQVVTEGGSVNSSEDLQAQPVASSPGGSAVDLPGAPSEALGRRPLDSSLYAASEEDTYMRSMTSLLGRDEGAISSLADIMVWSESALGVATGFLATGHGSVTHLLQSTGPRLRPICSLLRNVGLAFSSRLIAGTGLALRSVTHRLERLEQRAVERISSAVHYLTSHLALHRSGPSSN